MKRLATLFLLLFIGCQSFADEKKAAPAKQPAKEQPEEAEVPPPKTLVEALEQLEKLLPNEELAKIDAMKKPDEMIEYHFSLGMSIRNAWGLWGGGPLAQQMKKLGINHPDSMSSAILEAFWCRRHNKDYKVWFQEQAAYNAAYLKASAAPPKSAKYTKDGSDVDWRMSLDADSDEKKPRLIHVGKSKKTGRWLAYEHDKGVYEPGAPLLKRIADSEKPAPTDPFAPSEKKPITK